MLPWVILMSAMTSTLTLFNIVGIIGVIAQGSSPESEARNWGSGGLHVDHIFILGVMWYLLMASAVHGDHLEKADNETETEEPITTMLCQTPADRVLDAEGRSRHHVPLRVEVPLEGGRESDGGIVEAPHGHGGRHHVPLGVEVPLAGGRGSNGGIIEAHHGHLVPMRVDIPLDEFTVDPPPPYESPRPPILVVESPPPEYDELYKKKRRKNKQPRH